MKILLIIDDYLPSSEKVSPKMMHELACEYIKQGHQVGVITPNSDINTGVDVLKIDGVKIYRYKAGRVKNVSRLTRAINETLLSYYAWKHLKAIFKKERYEVIVYISPSIFFGPLVYKLKRLWNAKSYLVLRDFFPQWVIDNGLLRKHSPVAYYFKLFERINYSAADVIGVMSFNNLEWFGKYYRKNKYMEVLYNWSSINPVVNCTREKYRKSLGLNGKVVYFYGGNMGHAQDMMSLVRLANHMREKTEAHFVFVGSGDEVNLVKNAILHYGLKNITLLPSVNQEEYKEMLLEFDVGLITLHKSHKTHNFPGKILGYMANKMPILGSVNLGNDLKDVIEEFNAGYICINGEDDLLARKAEKLLDKDCRVRIGINARKLITDKFSVNKASIQILEKFDRPCKVSSKLAE